MKAPLFNMQGEKTGETELDAAVFEVVVIPELVQQAIETQNANRRVVHAHTKLRSEVSGGGKKPWRQKGTGRARHGSSRSPLWAGGGVTFGPRNDYNPSKKINIKARRKALLGVLSEKAKNGSVVVIEKLAMETSKTKDLTSLIAKLPGKAPTLVIMPAASRRIALAARNVQKLETILANSLNVRDVLKAQRLVIAQESLQKIRDTYAKA
ncbi:MAG: 50S ribosomal protein L4 [Patescibacteria group bacterium]|jgi:large subunit ribosomal protein L4